jgi:hypothetical protein
MSFGLGILSDLRAIANAVRGGDLLAAAAIAAKYTDTPHDDEALKLVDEIVHSSDPEVWFKNGYAVAHIVVKLTPSDFDNQVVAAIDQVADEQVFQDLLAWVRSLWFKTPVPATNTFGSFPAGAEGEPDKAIPLPVIISIASLIVNLIRLIRKDK